MVDKCWVQSYIYIYIYIYIHSREENLLGYIGVTPPSSLKKKKN